MGKEKSEILKEIGKNVANIGTGRVICDSCYGKATLNQVIEGGFKNAKSKI